MSHLDGWVAKASDRRTVCQRCEGPAYRHTVNDHSEPRGPWLHLREEDWNDNPHNVVPRGADGNMD